MQIETAEALIHALRACGLFSREQLQRMVRELKPLGDDAPTLMRHILQREWMSLYQLRKLLHGKAAELTSRPLPPSQQGRRRGHGQGLSLRPYWR